MSNLNLLVTGSLGRMGKAVIDCAAVDEAVHVAHDIDVGDSLLAVLPKVDCVIDFSFHGFTKELMLGCGDLGKSAVIGTTGHSDEELEFISETAKKVPIVLAPNYSIGVKGVGNLGLRLRHRSGRNASSSQERCSQWNGQTSC